MATARMQFRDDGFVTVTNIGGVINVSAPTLRAKRWGVKQLKRKASAFGITLRKKNGAWYADYQKMKDAEYRLFESLKECWVSPTNSDLRKAFGFRGKNILDKGF